MESVIFFQNIFDVFLDPPPRVRYPKLHSQVFRKHCPKAAASEAFEWAVILVSVVLVRAIKARSGVVGLFWEDLALKNKRTSETNHGWYIVV